MRSKLLAALIGMTALAGAARADIVFLSNQLRPIEEAEKVRQVILKDFEEPVDFVVDDEAEAAGYHLMTTIIDIDLNAFVRANLSGGDSNRHEWGFLKPLIRRDFLTRHGLVYDETLRLGEDYDLYVRMLQAGARFRAIREVGYAARWRDDSLSSRHRTADLAALCRASESHLAAYQAANDGPDQVAAASQCIGLVQ